MPNHVVTEVTAPDEVLDALLVDGDVDFNTLVPSPPNKEAGDCSQNHEPGEICWYTWNVDNWGTKWNGYETEREEGRLLFQTAWSHPLPVIHALSKKFPNVEIHVRYADEDLGHSCATYALLDRSVTAYAELSGSEAGLEMACELHGQNFKEVLAERQAD